MRKAMQVKPQQRQCIDDQNPDFDVRIAAGERRVDEPGRDGRDDADGRRHPLVERGRATKA